MDMEAAGVVERLMAVAEVGVLWAEADRGRAIPRLAPKERARTWGTPGKSKATATAAGGGARSTRSTDIPGLTWKRLGEMAEAAFLAKVSGLGFGVAKPWGDSDRYDFIVDACGDRGRRLWRVQVKSAHRVGEDGGYSFRLHGTSLESYRADEIDFLVAYVVPENAWYVFPMSEVEKHRSLKLYPGSGRKRSKFERYREAWEMLLRIAD